MSSIIIEFASYLLCTASIYFLYDQKPWKGSMGSKALTLIAFGLVFSPLVGATATAVSDLIWKPIMLAFIFGGLWFGTNKLIKRFGLHSTKASDEYISGTRIVSVDELNREVRKLKGPAGPKIGEIETKLEHFGTHFNVSGATGAGKSLVLRQILEFVRKNNIKCIFLDPGAEFMRYYWRDGDKLLNPNDVRSENWSLFAEMTSETDAARLTKSLIPDGVGSNATWAGYAQSVLEETIKQIYSGHSQWSDTNGNVHNDLWNGTNGELYSRLVIDSNDFSSARLNGTAAGKLMQGAGEMVSSFMAIVGKHMRPFQSLNPDAGRDAFSIRRWVEDDTENGILWMTYDFAGLESIKPLLGMWLDIASTSILNLPTDRNRKIFFIADEFPLLKADSVELLLTNGRKKGAHVVLASQAQSQWVATYGENKATTFLANMKAVGIFQAVESKTMNYFSELLGKQLVETKTYSGGGGKGAGWSKNITERVLVTPSEIKSLQSRHFYLSLPGLPVAKTIAPLPPADYQQVTEGFVLKSDLKKPEDKKFDDIVSASGMAPVITSDVADISGDTSSKDIKAVAVEDKSITEENDLPFSSSETEASLNEKGKSEIDIDSQTRLIDF